MAVIVSQACNVLSIGEIDINKAGKSTKLVPCILMCPIYKQSDAKYFSHLGDVFTELAIKKMNVKSDKISFDNPLEVANNLKTGQVMFFSPLSGFELKKYTKARHPERFVSKSAVIHIPDLTIEDFINIFECDGTGIHEITIGVT